MLDRANECAEEPLQMLIKNCCKSLCCYNHGDSVQDSKCLNDHTKCQCCPDLNKNHSKSEPSNSNYRLSILPKKSIILTRLCKKREKQNTGSSLVENMCFGKNGLQSNERENQNDYYSIRIECIGLKKCTTTKSLDQSGKRKKNGFCGSTVRISIIYLNPFPNSETINQPHPKSDSYRLKSEHSNKLSKYQLHGMAFKIDDFTIQEDQVKGAKEVFKRFDKRGQDKISTTDLGPAFRALNLTVKPDTLKEWADQVDDDATGFIDFNGFLTCYGKKLQEDQDERDLRDAFRVLDKNKRGEIDVEDLRWILKGLGDDLTEEEIDDMIRDTDTDGSGFVDFDEFYKLMTSE